MNFFFMARSLLFSFFLLLPFSSAACAEWEYYDFPVPASERKPQFSVKPLFVSKKSQPPKTERATKRRQAQQKSIEGLLRRYNKKLNEQMALKYTEYILHASEKFQQDPFVVAAMIVNESSARHDAVSRGGDYGLMQVRWRVHRRDITQKYPHIKNAKGILDPKYNVLVGTEILARYCAAAPDLRGGLMRYSAGNRKLAEKIFAVLKGLQNSYEEHLRAL